MIAPLFPRVNNATMMNFLGERTQITTDAIDNFNVEGVGNDLYDTGPNSVKYKMSSLFAGTTNALEIIASYYLNCCGATNEQSPR